jgi:hypothetical protein
MPPDHHPYYCEENIHRLIASDRLANDAVVVLVTNAHRSVACWSQRLAPEPGQAVVWDYHVVAVEPGEAREAARVWDLDSVLEPPCSLDTWLTATFRPGVPEQLDARFRVVEGALWVAEFASDRSHMLAEDGAWLHPPPPWPPPGGGEGSNLDRWLDQAVGEWLGLEELWNLLKG